MQRIRIQNDRLKRYYPLLSPDAGSRANVQVRVPDVESAVSFLSSFFWWETADLFSSSVLPYNLLILISGRRCADPLGASS